MPPAGIKNDPSVGSKEIPPELTERVRDEQKRLAEKAVANGHGIRGWTMSKDGAASICYGACAKCGAVARIVYRKRVDRFEFEGGVLHKPCPSRAEPIKNDRPTASPDPQYETVWGGGEGLTTVRSQRESQTKDTG
jgi:hypothetical protein